MAFNFDTPPVNFLLTLKYKMIYYLNSPSNTMNKYKQIKRELKNKKDLVACAQQLGVVGDTTRLKICYLLCHYPEFSVGEMADILDTSVSVVSHSVKKLLELGLVARRKEAQTVYYSLSGNKFNKALKEFITN